MCDTVVLTDALSAPVTFPVPFVFHRLKVTSWEPPQPSTIAIQRKDRSIYRQGQLAKAVWKRGVPGKTASMYHVITP